MADHTEDDEGPMRSYVKTGKVIPKACEYKKGEEVRIKNPNKNHPSITIKIFGEGRWNAGKKDWEYQLELDGKLYKDGEWFLENNL